MKRGGANRYDAYIEKVLKQVHPGHGLTWDAMRSIDSMIKDVVSRLCHAANDLTQANKKQTVTARDIQTAVMQVFPAPELDRHALAEGTKALTKFNSTATAAGKNKSKGHSGRTLRAGLVFSPARVERQLRSCSSAKRVGAGAPVFLAAVAEYVAAEVLELAGNSSRDRKRRHGTRRLRITSRDVMLAVRNDMDLDALLGGVIARGGVRPNIEHQLLPTKKKQHAENYMRCGWDDRFDDEAELDYVGGGDDDYDDDDDDDDL